MCEKCAEIDEKVERYRSLASRLLDSSTIEGIEALITELLAASSRARRIRPPQLAAIPSANVKGCGRRRGSQGRVVDIGKRGIHRAHSGSPAFAARAAT
jgi:hypothetical protein